MNEENPEIKDSYAVSLTDSTCLTVVILFHYFSDALSANVNINYRLPIKVYYRICTLKTYQNRNKIITLLYGAPPFLLIRTPLA
jgi:beta-mannanase